VPNTADDGTLVALRSARLSAVLVVGMVAGAILTGTGLIGTDSRRRPTFSDAAAARVNDRVLTRDLVDRVTRDVAAQRQVPVDEQLRRSVVEGLIDEELLVQRALALGLPSVDRRVRSGLARAAIERIVQGEDFPAPSDAELQSFLDAHPESFSPAAKLRVRHMRFAIVGGDTDAALARATAAGRRLSAGEDFAAVKAQAADPEIAPLPDALLPRGKLLDYLGPAVLQAAVVLPPGTTSEPIRSANAYNLVQVLEREAATRPDFARVRDQVLKEYQRQEGDKWLRATLERLRAEARVTVAND
jgi:parvulin-like peptidyl-prolyl isomerase